MSDHGEMPPVLQILGDDLIVAMKEAAARPRRGRRRRRRGLLVGWTTRRWATVAVLALGALTATLALVLPTSGSGPSTPIAFADWTATPASPSSAQLQVAEAACTEKSSALNSLTPTASYFDGQNALLIYAGAATTSICETGSPAFGTTVVLGPTISTPVPDDAIEPETSGLKAVRTGQLYFTLTGRVGDGVTAVTLVLGDGTTVSTTVANGWFAAWWPATRTSGQTGQGGPIGHAAAQSAQITTTSGTTTQTLDLHTVHAPLGINGTSREYLRPQADHVRRDES